MTNLTTDPEKNSTFPCFPKWITVMISSLPWINDNSYFREPMIKTERKSHLWIPWVLSQDRTHICRSTKNWWPIKFFMIHLCKIQISDLSVSLVTVCLLLHQSDRAIMVVQEMKEGRKAMFLFNDALNTFYLRLYGVRHMVKNHTDSERGNSLPPHGLLFPISSKGSFICIILQTG